MSSIPPLMPDGCFAFMRLPLELPRKVYKLLFVTECCQPGASKENERKLTRYPQETGEVISVGTLRMSKAIQDKAVPIFYSRNMFTVVATGELEWYHVQYGLLEARFHDYVKKHPKEYPAEMPWEQRVWVAAQPTVIEGAEKSFDSDGQSLPHWLLRFGETTKKPSKSTTSPASATNYQPFFASLPYGTACFHIYSETLRQHLPRPRRLFILYLFEAIRTLHRDIPSLTELAVLNAFDGLLDISKANMEKKRHEKSLDITKLWESLTPNRVHWHGVMVTLPPMLFNKKWARRR
ncbi:hypothetical protein ABVK25_005721 [Lepraria finkii]|uniref:Uncharacterized protein n=1 Tax=Lepraria finkii TaxID=1340010 RepID=A0ABR4B9X2_9LECA